MQVILLERFCSKASELSSLDLKDADRIPLREYYFAFFSFEPSLDVVS